MLHLLLICQFELKRLFTSRKGLLYLITFAVVWYFILFYPIRFAADLLEREQGTVTGSRFFDFLGFGSLLNWKIAEFAVYWHFALLLFPFLTFITSADQTSSDRERGTLRFLCLRMSRDSLFFGRFAGTMMTHLLFILLTLLSTLTLVLYRDASLLAEALQSAMVIALSLFLVLLPFSAMMAVLSVSVKSARQASVWAVLIWSSLSGIISLVAAYLPVVETLKILIPGYQMSALAQLSEWQTLQLAYIPVLQSVVLLLLGRWVMYRQSI